MSSPSQSTEINELVGVIFSAYSELSARNVRDMMTNKFSSVSLRHFLQALAGLELDPMPKSEQKREGKKEKEGKKEEEKEKGEEKDALIFKQGALWHKAISLVETLLNKVFLFVTRCH